MTLSSMVVSRDWPEVSVLECILGSLHIGVDVEPEPERARTKLAKTKVDALIVDFDLTGTGSFLQSLQSQNQNLVPLVIVSGSKNHKKLHSAGASFVFEKPISVEQAVHTLSAARNMIMGGRLRYHRQRLDLPVSLSYGPRQRIEARITNISQGGVGILTESPLPIDKPLRVAFALPGTKTSVKLIGRAAWADPQGHVGVRFVQISRRSKRDLQLWLEKRYFAGM